MLGQALNGVESIDTHEAGAAAINHKDFAVRKLKQAAAEAKLRDIDEIGLTFD